MVNVVSLLCGFLTIFVGVYLLNTAKNDGLGLMDKPIQTGTGILRSSISGERRDSLMRTRDATLFNAFDEESLGLTQLNDDLTDSEDD